MTELTGKSLGGRYQLATPLGQGGMGSVYLAHDRILARDVAIKVMHGRYADRSDFQQRFVQEARTEAKLSHPGIVQIFDFGQTDDVLYIVMELILGENLEQMMRRLRRKQQWVVLPEAVEVIRQIALALDYAHRQGVLHRDIKPANIMLKAEVLDTLPYRPIVADLGLAKLAEGGLETQIGLTMGTPAYMSPEQTRGDDVDARSDVYSLGILLYELTVGQLPFPIKTLTQALRYHMQEEPPAPHTLCPDLPAAVEAIILKALQKEPAQRYRTAGELAQALHELVIDTLAATVPPIANAGGSSLITQYRESLIELRDQSIVLQKQGKDNRPAQIVVRAPDDTEKSIQLTGSLLTVGRLPDKDVFLDDAKVSRGHAKIEYDNVTCWVTDLESSNGTFIGKVRLKPNVRVIWEMIHPLRIGDHVLFLQATPAESQTQIDSVPPSTTYEPPHFVASPARQTIVVTTPKPELTIEPGQSIQLPVALHNPGAQTEQFQMTITGIPREWITASPAVLTLAPGARQQAGFTITPPRTPQTAARRYPLTIQVDNQRAPEQKTFAQCGLTITPYAQFYSSLTQLPDHQRQQIQVRLENRGNAPQNFHLSWRDATRALAFEPAYLDVQATSGQTVAVETKVHSRRRHLFGWQKSHALEVRVDAANGVSETHHTIYVSRPLVPIWLSGLLLLLFISTAGALLVYGQRSGGIGLLPDANQGSAKPANTPIAQIVADAPKQNDVTPATADNNPPATVSAIVTAALPITPTSVPVIDPPTIAPTSTNTPTPPTPTVDAQATAQSLALAATTEAQTTATQMAATQIAATQVAATQVAAENAASQAATAAALATAEFMQAQQATQAAIAAAEAAAEATQTTEAVAAAAAQAAMLTAQAPTPIPGLTTSFEDFGVWRHGAEPWGEFTQSSQGKASGSNAAKFDYDFSAAKPENDYVVFFRQPSIPLDGQAKGFRLQVYGDGSGNFLNVWLRDNLGQTWAFSFGKISHNGWQEMSAPFDPDLGWPNGIVQDDKGARPTPPFTFLAFVIDGQDRRALKGTVLLDELVTTDSPARPNLAGGQAPAPAATAAPAANPGEANIACGVDPPTIHAGEAATLYWVITDVSAVFLQGNEGVGGIEKRSVSPTQTTVYTLRIVRKDGSETTCVMTVQVN